MFCGVRCRQKNKWKTLPVLTKNCLRCNKEFKTQKKLKTYCCQGCAMRKTMPVKRDRRDCLRCGNNFQPKTSVNVYCSKECLNPTPKIRQGKCKTCDVKLADNRRVYCSPCKQVKIKEQRKKQKERERLYSMPSSTVSSVKRLITKYNMNCSICSWDKGTCDLHHIKGRKIEDPHAYTNLTLLCPNCHRLVHEDKIPESDIVNFQQQLDTHPST